MIEPLSDIPISPLVASLPKADLHVHQEELARLERVVSRELGRASHDWRRSARRLMAEVAPGSERLGGMYTPDATLDLGGVQGNEPAYIIAKIADALEEGAADGALLVEVRFGPGGQAIIRPDFMALFREAERRVQLRYPNLRAEAIGFLFVSHDPQRQQEFAGYLETFLRLANEGLGGIDFLVSPYHLEADPATWQVAYEWAARAADVGLGVTVHAGEFSGANLTAALRLPGLSRIGHGIYLAAEPRLLDEVVRRSITLECCLSCNVVLGGVPSYATHPIGRLMAAGVPITLNTDDPVRVWTTIGREYAIAALLGFTEQELRQFTENGLRAAFRQPTAGR